MNGVAPWGAFTAAVVDHVWQSSLVAAFILVTLRIARRAPARWIEALSLVALAKLVLPLALVGSWTSQLLLSWVEPTPAGPWGPIAANLLSLSVAPVIVPSGALAPVASWKVISALLAALALAIVTRELFRLASSIRAAQRLSRTACKCARSPLAEARMLEAIGSARIPADRILLVGTTTAPCVAGWWRPRIVFPIALAEELEGEGLRAVLLHEDVHRRRRDPLRMLAWHAATLPFAFVPFRGTLLAALARATELVCDETVVRRGADPEAYAAAIVHVARRGFATAGVSSLMGMPVLSSRLARIRGQRRKRLMISHRLTLGAAITLVGALSFTPVAFLSSCARERAANPETATRSTTEHAAFDVPPAMKEPPVVAYPEDARAAGITGRVFVEITLDAEGHVARSVVAKSELLDAQGVALPADHALGRALEEVARAASADMSFDPARRDGVPVAATVVLPIAFALS